MRACVRACVYKQTPNTGLHPSSNDDCSQTYRQGSVRQRRLPIESLKTNKPTTAIRHTYRSVSENDDSYQTYLQVSVRERRQLPVIHTGLCQTTTTSTRHTYRSVSENDDSTRHTYRSVSENDDSTRHTYRSVSENDDSYQTYLQVSVRQRRQLPDIPTDQCQRTTTQC